MRGVWVRWGGVVPVVLGLCYLKEPRALATSAHSSGTSAAPTTTSGHRHGTAACRRHGRTSHNAPSKREPQPTDGRSDLEERGACWDTR